MSWKRGSKAPTGADLLAHAQSGKRVEGAIALLCRDGHTRYAHKAILKLKSEYFRSLLNTKPKISFFKVPFSAEIIDLVLRHLYVGSLYPSNSENAIFLCCAARKFKIHTLSLQLKGCVRHFLKTYLEKDMSAESQASKIEMFAIKNGIEKEILADLLAEDMRYDENKESNSVIENAMFSDKLFDAAVKLADLHKDTRCCGILFTDDDQGGQLRAVLLYRNDISIFPRRIPVRSNEVISLIVVGNITYVWRKDGMINTYSYTAGELLESMETPSPGENQYFKLIPICYFACHDGKVYAYHYRGCIIYEIKNGASFQIGTTERPIAKLDVIDCRDNTVTCIYLNWPERNVYEKTWASEGCDDNHNALDSEILLINADYRVVELIGNEKGKSFFITKCPHEIITVKNGEVVSKIGIPQGWMYSINCGSIVYLLYREDMMFVDTVTNTITNLALKKMDCMLIKRYDLRN